MRALALTFTLLIAAAAPGQNAAPKPLQPPAQRQGLIFWNMSRPYVDFLIQHVPQSNAARFLQLKQIFTDLQCSPPRLREQPAPQGKTLTCTLPGNLSAAKPSQVSAPKPGTILFIANYEHEGSGQSVIDNWSGALMLPFLYHAVSASSRQHTFLFAEVDGASGAKTFFDSFTPQQRHSIQGVIALDCLGLGPVQFYVSPFDSFTEYNDSWLLHQLRQAAIDQRLAQPVSAIPGRWFKVDVTREFRFREIPSIFLHSVNWRTRELPGSGRDTPAAIDPGVYFNTFTLLAGYIIELDQPPPALNATPSSPPRGRRR
jgi:hypothetical protein